MSTSWQKVIGHEWAVQLLIGAIEQGRLGHAYLFTGPQHIGRTTLARTFAQALNCQAEAVHERPCGQCRACSLIAGDRHPDVRLVKPDVSIRGKATLKIEPIRDLLHDLNLRAYEGRYKVAILKDFDAATTSAANAFLKTLEEPPNRVVLMLTARDSDSLLPTITSRCRTLGLRPLPTSLIEMSLQTRWQIPADEAHLLAHLADGRLGWAILASQDSSLLASRQAHLDQLYQALVGDRVARFELADQLSGKAEALPDVLRSWLSWWRDVSLVAHRRVPAAGIPSAQAIAITNVDQRAFVERMARAWDPRKILASFKQTNLALWQLERNANARLLLENLLLVYPYEVT